MQELKNKEDVRKLGRILGVWAHPDDETFMMGGLMAIARQNGQAVACITATKGEKGSQDKSQWKHLAEVRSAELMAALDILGVQEHHWLGYVDGETHSVNQDEAIHAVAAIIKAYKPDTVVTFAPDGSTGHPDHIAVSSWACAATKKAGSKADIFYAVDCKEQYDAFLKEADAQFNIYFNVEEPAPVPKADCDLVLCLTPEASACKYDALCAMPSQTKAMMEAIGKDRFLEFVDCETFVKSTFAHRWATPKRKTLQY